MVQSGGECIGVASTAAVRFGVPGIKWLLFSDFVALSLCLLPLLLLAFVRDIDCLLLLLLHL